MTANVKIAERLERQAEDMRIQQNLGSYADTCEEAAAALRSPSPAQGMPTPESLRQLAAWFDDPKNPRVFVEKLGKSAGYLAGLIADALAKQLDEGGK